MYQRETPVKGRNGSKIYSSTSDWQRVVDRAKYLKKIQMKCGNQGDLISYQIMHKEIESQPITLLPSLTLLTILGGVRKKQKQELSLLD